MGQGIGLGIVIEGRLYEGSSWKSGEVMRKAGRSIGKALSCVINLFNPGLVILGGQLAKAGPCLIDPLVESAGGFTLPGPFRAAAIVLNEKVFKL